MRTFQLGLLCLSVGLAMAAAGCDQGGGDPDAGPPRDARVVGMDAWVRPDAGPPECTGSATACATLSVGDCDTVDGCVVSTCGGTAVACDRYADQGDCEGTAGCRWEGSSCSGTATACERLAGSDACMAQQGCAFNPSERCRGVATRCGSLPAARCTSQPGCMLAGPIDAGPRDAGPRRDAGSMCIPPEGPSPHVGCNPDDGIQCDGDWEGFCTPACSASQCCSPQRGSFACVARDASGNCPAADLFVDDSMITGNYYVEYRNFDEGDCAIVEGCVGGPGLRRLLRFDTWTPNTGTADMFLGRPTDAATAGHFEYSDCHRHYHFNSYAEYELLTDDEACVAATGHKQAFCLLDYYRYPGRDGTGGTYGCGYQGIQRDWQDVYSAGLDCQWVDVTDVEPGNYVLRIRINTEHILYETNYENNEVRVPVTITAPPPDTDVTVACTTAREGPARECGWTNAGTFTCTPGEYINVGCSAGCSLGSCTGDSIMRICEASRGDECTSRWILAQNDDSGCAMGDLCSRTEFFCPASGMYNVFTGAYRSAEVSTCTPMAVVGTAP